MTVLMYPLLFALACTVTRSQAAVDGATTTTPSLRRGLKKVSFDIPDMPENVDWFAVVVAILVVWLVLSCLCNCLQALFCRTTVRRAEYTPIYSANRGLYHYNEPPPPAYNPDYRSPHNDKTCRNMFWAACCFECCCRDNRDVDCCEVCCCLCAYEICCPRS